MNIMDGGEVLFPIRHKVSIRPIMFQIPKSPSDHPGNDEVSLQFTATVVFFYGSRYGRYMAVCQNPGTPGEHQNSW